MSRCTPNIHAWGTRAKRYGGKAGIAAKRAEQFQKLAAIAGSPNGPPATPEESNARDYLAFLEGNPVRVLSVNTEMAIGFRKDPEQVRQEELAKLEAKLIEAGFFTNES